MKSEFNPDNYLTVHEAARCLEVSATTMRSWENKSGVQVFRHPKYGYRLYTINDLKAILDAIKGEPGFRTI